MTIFNAALGRRDFVRSAAALAAAMQMANDAWAAGQPLGVLKPHEASTLAALGDTLLPGASEAGLVHFIDAQLLKPPEKALLTLRYIDVPAPFAPFYTGVVAALDEASRQANAMPFVALGAKERISLVQVISSGNPPGWSGPPAPLAYFALRSDALDALYGTVAGYRRLDLPYLPHITPERPW